MAQAGLLAPGTTFYSRRGDSDGGTQAGIPKGLPARQTEASSDLARAINADLARAGTAERVRLREIAHDDLPQELRVALQAFGDATGTRAVVFRNLTPDVLDINGVNLRDGRLFLSENADRPLVTVLSHEFLHQLRRDAPELYALLEAEVRRQGDLTGFAAKLGKQGERNPERVAPEELTADAVGDALSDRDFLQHLAERNPGVFRRVADAFTRFLDGLLAKLGKARDLGSNRYLQDVQAFRDVLADVLAKYAPRHVAPEAGRVQPNDAISDVQPHFQRQDAQTDTPEFRRWFGDSKVLNEDGTPRTVYHGTGSEFWAFKGDRLGDSTGHMTAPLGHFFAEDRAKAERYAEKAADYVPADQRVIDAHLAIRNPKRMTLDELMAVDNPDAARALRARLQRDGYDGIHVPEIGQWVAFEPTQIKSASENRGSFDPENPDIRYSRSDRTRSDYERRVDDLLHGAMVNAVGVRVLDRSDLLDALGYADKPVHAAEGKLLAAVHNHGLNADALKKLPEWIDHPAAAFDSDTVGGRLVLVAPELVNGKPVFIVLQPDADAAGLSAHLLVNAYDKRPRRFSPRGALGARRQAALSGPKNKPRNCRTIRAQIAQ